jgi:hypothetical protein
MQRRAQPHDLLEPEYAMSVEEDPGSPNRNDDQQVSTWGENPEQLTKRPDISVRVKRFAVSAQPDMFKDVHT